MNELKGLLPEIKSHYILTTNNRLKLPLPFNIIVESEKRVLFGQTAKTKLHSNQPLIKQGLTLEGDC